jgi:arylsulfatase A-like enzyme
MNRRRFLSTLASAAAAPWGLSVSFGATGGLPPVRRPNIILIVIDDLGYADLGCQGAKDVLTPHIDSLAPNGVRFTDGYVCSPVCFPSRCGMLTGRYPQRYGVEFNPIFHDPDPAFALPLTERTLADLLHDHGYATAAIGKWHLGSHPAHHPLRRGFDEFFGFLGGSRSYLQNSRDTSTPLLRGTRAVDEPEYLTDAFTREAVAFIERHQRRPFFLHVAYNALHVPLELPPRIYLDRFRHIDEEKRRIYAAMLAAVDDGVGDILNTLRFASIEDDTLIFFISDNGGPTAGTSSRNTPFHGGKGSLREGGIRVPFLMQWKNHLPPAVYRRPVISLDILPTALAAAGVTVPAALDGVNILPHLAGDSPQDPHPVLFWRYGLHWAIRADQWKLLKHEDMPPYLFDLTADPGERFDRSSDNPAIVQTLLAAHRQWTTHLAPLHHAPVSDEQRD